MLWFKKEGVNPAYPEESVPFLIKVPYSGYTYKDGTEVMILNCCNGQRFYMECKSFEVYHKNIDASILKEAADYSDIHAHRFCFKKIEDDEASEFTMEFSLYYYAKELMGHKYYDCALCFVFDDKIKAMENFKVRRVHPQTGEEVNYVNDDFRCVTIFAKAVKNKKLKKIYDKFLPSYEGENGCRIPDVFCDKEYKHWVWEARLRSIYNRFYAWKKSVYDNWHVNVRIPYRKFFKENIAPKLKKLRAKRAISDWLR